MRDCCPFCRAQRAARRTARFRPFRPIGGHLFRFAAVTVNVSRGASSPSDHLAGVIASLHGLVCLPREHGERPSAVRPRSITRSRQRVRTRQNAQECLALAPPRVGALSGRLRRSWHRPTARPAGPQALVPVDMGRGCSAQCAHAPVQSGMGRCACSPCGDSTASAVTCGPDPHADVEGDRT